VLYVIDAGVVVKWFIPEVESALAHQLLARYLQGVDTPVAPDLLISECANVFWRRCRQGDITPAEATESVADLVTLTSPWCQQRAWSNRLYNWHYNISVASMMRCIWRWRRSDVAP
jgi:predicted nucleic acid-binding protein